MFKEIGYFKEYYSKGKFLGTVNNCEKDRDIIGYNGKKVEILESDLILDNNKKIKSLTEVTTMLYPMCGKIINK